MADSTNSALTENRLAIGEDLRAVEIPQSQRILGARGDADVRRVWFELPRECDGTDLSAFTPTVHYINALGTEDVYIVTDNAATGDTVAFSWLVGRSACVEEGEVRVSVKLREYASDGQTVTREFNSGIFTMTVVEALDSSAAVDAEKLDTVTAILLEVREASEAAKSAATAANAAAENADAKASAANDAAASASSAAQSATDAASAASSAASSATGAATSATTAAGAATTAASGADTAAAAANAAARSATDAAASATGAAQSATSAASTATGAASDAADAADAANAAAQAATTAAGSADAATAAATGAASDASTAATAANAAAAEANAAAVIADDSASDADTATSNANSAATNANTAASAASQATTDANAATARANAAAQAAEDAAAGALPTMSASVKGGAKLGAGLTMSGEVLSADVKVADVTRLEGLISAIPRFETLVVEALPDAGEAAKVYLVRNSEASGPDLYDEYVWVSGAYEHLGTARVDLSGYATTAYVDGEVEALEGSVALKASQSDLEALQSAVGGKASQSDLTELTATVATKADASTVSALSETVAGKQAQLAFDSAPTSGSSNPVTSNGVAAALSAKQDALTAGTGISISNGTISVSFDAASGVSF